MTIRNAIGIAIIAAAINLNHAHASTTGDASTTATTSIGRTSITQDSNIACSCSGTTTRKHGSHKRKRKV